MKKNRTIITGHLFFLTLVVLSLYFSKERILFADCAYHLYQFINSKNFQVFNLRFISVLTQMVPLYGIGQGWPLNTLVLSYSLSFIALPYLYFILVAHVIRDMAVARLFILFHAVFTLHTFFWVQSEFPQGLMLLFLAYAILRMKGKFSHIMFVVLIIPVLFSHPMILFPIVFIMLFEMADSGDFKQPYYWSVILFAIAFFFLKSKLPWTAYEEERISVTKLWRNIPGFIHFRSNRLLLKWLFTDYFLLLIGLVINTIYYIRKGRYLKFSLGLGFFIGYAALVNLANPDMQSRLQFYFENLYLPLGLFVCLPLAVDVMKSWSSLRQSLLLTLTSALKILLILMVSKEFTARLHYLEEMIQAGERFTESKFIVPLSDLNMNLIKIEWALPCETLLYSSRSNKNGSSTIISSAKPQDVLLKGKGMILEPFATSPQSDLDKRYFNLSGENYRIIPLNE